MDSDTAKIFDDVGLEPRPTFMPTAHDQWFTLNFDGGSRGNPGPAGVGAVVYAEDGTPVITVGKFIGRATNNIAEYKGLITVMEQALALGARRVIIRGDSELIIKQMRGEYRVKNPELRVLYDQAQSLLRQFDQYKLEHNLRGKNELADKLANLAMDKKRDVIDEDGTPGPVVSMAKENAPSPRPTRSELKRWECDGCGLSLSVTVDSALPEIEQQPVGCVCGKPMVKKA